MNMELLLNSNPSGLYFDKVFETISELSNEDNINAVLPGRLVFCKENSAIYRRIRLNNDNSYELLSYFGGSSDESIPGLPKVTTNDNGKVLRVVSGIWDKDDLPSDLPNIEGSEDERKVLGVVDGEWDKISLDNFAIVINITQKGQDGASDTTYQKIANANTGYKLTSSDIPVMADTTTQIFDGWHYNTSEGDRANINDVIFTDIVLVQKWINKKHFTITYSDNQERVFDEKIVHKYIDPSLSSYTITQNDLNFKNITGKTSPVRINKGTYVYQYTFNNWYNQTLGNINTSTILNISQDNQPFKFFVDWTKAKKFSISYSILYGTYQPYTREIQVGYDDTTYTLTNNELPDYDSHKPITGDKWYYADGWKDSNNNIVTTGSSIEAANITLQANYIEKSTYTIKYDTNGKGTTPSNYRYNSVKDYSTTGTFSMNFPSVNLPTRPEGVSDDWNFDGWSYNGNTYTQDSGSIQINFENNTKEVTFVAQWSVNNNKVCYYGALSEKAAPTAAELNNLSSILLTNGNNDFTVPISSNNSQYVFFMYPASLTGITQYFYDGTGYQSGGFSNELEQATYNNIIYNLYITRQTQSGSVKIRLKKGEE